MKVFKFGGASVKDAESIKNVAKILAQYVQEDIVVVVSAMGKTTNALEAVTNAYVGETGKAHTLLNQLKAKHFEIAKELFGEKAYKVQAKLRDVLSVVSDRLNTPPRVDYDFIYDQIVSAGELLSTLLVSAYLNEQGVNSEWLDVRNCICTDNTYREGKVDWEATTREIQRTIPELLAERQFVVTQGFLGGTIEGFTTTLGREGSDYTAAVFANCLDAELMCVWKDVPGILNADPRLVENAVKIPKLSYYEAIEMTYYGARVIHPKTVKPLQNKGIPLHVRSFKKPEETGTIIGTETSNKSDIPPMIVIKPKQLLLSVSTKDFSFMAENNLSKIYDLFAKHRIKTNLTQNAAVSFSACIDDTPNRIKALLDDLSRDYKVITNDGLKLITIRQYTPETLKQYTTNKTVLLEQKTRNTIQIAIKEEA